MSSICYTTLFNIYIAGAEAARCRAERTWFIQQIVWLYPDVLHLDTMWQSIAEFFDPLAPNSRFIVEIWEDIVAARGGSPEATVNQDKQLVRPIKYFRPTSYAPDLTKPLPVFELRDVEEAAL